MINFGIIIFITLIFSKVSEYLFLRLQQFKITYKKSRVPFSGGTAVFLSIVSGLYIYYISGEISSFKLTYFLVVISTIYLIGLIDDIIGDRSIKGALGNLKAIINKKFSTGIIKAIGILIISCYINYFFNEEFWIIKGFLTAIITNMFNLFDLRPGRCIKIYLILFTVIPLNAIRWTNSIYMISIWVLAGYYFFDAYGYSMLGDSGSNLLGFIFGLVISESIGSNFIALLISFTAISTIQFLLDRYSLTKIIEKIPLLDYLDRFLTERQDEGYVKSSERNS